MAARVAPEPTPAEAAASRAMAAAIAALLRERFPDDGDEVAAADAAA